LNKPRLVLGPQLFHPRGFPLAIGKRLFFRGKFKIFNSRLIMLGLAVRVWRACTRSHNSSNVASGCFLRAPRMTFSHTSRVRGGPPVAGQAAQLPVVWYRAHHLSSVDSWILKSSAIPAWLF
jgi:hypothetical protein